MPWVWSFRSSTQTCSAGRTWRRPSLVFIGVSASEQAGCAILGGNYGESGAIDYYGPTLGLPKAIGGHNSYYYWGPRNYSGACVIIFGEGSSEFVKLFDDVHLAATITSPTPCQTSNRSLCTSAVNQKRRLQSYGRISR